MYCPMLAYSFGKNEINGSTLSKPSLIPPAATLDLYVSDVLYTVQGLYMNAWAAAAAPRG